MRTLVDLLEQSVQRWGQYPAVSLQSDHPKDWTYAALWERVRRGGAMLRERGVGKGDRVILWAPNRPEWVAAFFAIHVCGAVVVPLDLRSREAFLAEIEAQTQPRVIIAGKEQAAQLRGTHAPVIVLDGFEEPDAAALPQADDDRQAEAAAELVFTSGTTGNPKGVILTHANILANVRMFAPSFPATPKKRVLSILPLSHMFEQMAGLFIPLAGGASIIYTGSLRPDAIFAAMAERHITNMSCVPQVLQLFREGIEREVRKQGRLKQFERLHALAAHLPLPVRRLIFRQIQARMGGSFEYFVSGGAYLDPELARWWEALGIKVAQGYGMTEASPVVAGHSLWDRDPASVGRPGPGIDLQIAADGEILVRGANVMPGYWQNPEATAEVFVDGWYQTGDLGWLDGSGRLHLRGRKKNLIVLANGMNVYPEDLERELAADPRVKDAVVLGLRQGQDVEIHAVLLTASPESGSEIVRAANRRLAPHQQIRRHTVWPDETFPATLTLKPKRAEIEARLEELKRSHADS